MPYCGSTLLGSLLSLSPGVEAVGEVDQLVRWREQGKFPHAPACNRCGPSCGVWNAAIRARWIRDVELYPLVDALFPAAHTLVYSLKYTHLYERFGRPDVALVLVRHPQACAFSTWTREGTDPACYYQGWKHSYASAISWARWLDNYVVVSYERLVSDVLAQTNAVLAAIDCEPVAEVPRSPADFRDHQYCGNGGMRARGAISEDVRWHDAAIALAPAGVLAFHAGLQQEAV